MDRNEISGIEKRKKVCGAKTIILSRVTGYYSPIQNYNNGKKQEFMDRNPYRV